MIISRQIPIVTHQILVRHSPTIAAAPKHLLKSLHQRRRPFKPLQFRKHLKILRGRRRDRGLRSWRGGGGRGGAGGFAAGAADGDVAEGAAAGPVAAAGLAEVARLGDAVVVVVAEFGVGGEASRAARGGRDDVVARPPFAD